MFFEKVMAENLPNLLHQPTHLGDSVNSNRINVKRPTVRYILVKMLKLKEKEKILKAEREK